ncbi:MULTISPECIES: hypothetical protein [unclassified Streptomyces]|uniref:hypothetical protein n=1 Tax=unclassified Streptomyces TaxID=2593676 RepID=UPI0033BBACAB
MPRIKLANWYGDNAPGDELDVDDGMVKRLHRDGLVAEVIKQSAPDLQAAPTQPQEGIKQPVPVVETGRKRR